LSADSALRANIRLLGDLLGQVLVEQEDERVQRQSARQVEDLRVGDAAL